MRLMQEIGGVVFCIAVASGCGTIEKYNFQCQGDDSYTPGDAETTLRLDPVRQSHEHFSNKAGPITKFGPCSSHMIQFDLSKSDRTDLPKRVILRLRRKYDWMTEQDPSYSVRVFNVNVGLNVHKYGQYTQGPDRILSAVETSTDKDCWGKVSLHLSLILGNYDVYALSQLDAERDGKQYGVSVRDKNQFLEFSCKRATAWDEIDMTAFTLAEIKGDGSITLWIQDSKSSQKGAFYGAMSPGNIEWVGFVPSHGTYGDIDANPNLKPHLVLVYDK